MQSKDGEWLDLNVNSRWVSNDTVFGFIVGVKTCNMDAPFYHSFIILCSNDNPLMTKFNSVCRMVVHISGFL